MKIITSDAVYVQNNDIMYLTRSNSAIPSSIFLKVFGSGMVIIDDSNRFEFVKFDEKEEIEFFRKLDWIVDYEEVKDLSENEIIQLGQEITVEKNRIAKKYNSMSEVERKNNFELCDRYELLDYKVYSLRDFLWFKQGHIEMELPEGIERPEMLVPNEKKGIKRLIRTIFTKKNKEKDSE